MHWKSWDALCTPKFFGDMGFRRLEVFNLALLAKQAWCIHSDPTSLLGRVLKAKYFPHCSLLDASLGQNTSYSWRSIWSSKSLLKEGLIWKVGNGRNIDVWNDNWVVDENGMRATTPKSSDIIEMRVEELLDEYGKEWNFELVSRILNERDRDLILGIPISSLGGEDEHVWCFSNDGEFTMKSTYMLGSSVNPDSFDPLWPLLWSTKTIPKV